MKFCRNCEEQTCVFCNENRISEHCDDPNFLIRGAVFSASREKAEKQLNKIVEGQTVKMVRKNYDHMIYDTDHERWTWYPLSHNFRGYKFDKVYIDKDIQIDKFVSLIQPSLIFVLDGELKYF